MKIKEDKPAAHAGLKSGDIIMELGKFQVTIFNHICMLNELNPDQKSS